MSAEGGSGKSEVNGRPGRATKEEREEMERRALAALHEHAHKPLMVSLPLVKAFALCAQLQLALRHPLNVGQSTEVAREFIALIREHALHFDPALAEAIDAGNDSRFDPVIGAATESEVGG